MFHFPIERDDAFDLDVEPTTRASRVVIDRTRRLFRFESVDSEAEHLTAISEIVQNAVEAHRSAGLDHPVQIMFSLDPPAVRVVDHGGGFIWTGTPPSAPDPTAVSGRGLLIATAFVPDLQVRSDTRGTDVLIPLSGATPNP